MIRLVNCSIRYDGKLALNDVSLELAHGERLVLLGPSGSGKTTLLRLVAGLELPYSGEVYLEDRLASRPGWGLPPYARSIGFAFQTPTLWPHMNVTQNLLFSMDGGDKSLKNQTIHELADAFELGELLKRSPGQLSGGEARRVGLARALAPRPLILLLDEPLTHLDASLKEKVFAAALAFIGKFQPTVIFVSHDPAEAATLTSIGARLLHLEKGQICAP